MIAIEYLEIPEFTVEDVYIQSLNGGIKKKFTSSASSYSVVFKWKFGDEEKEDEYTTTKDRSIIHEYKKPGNYTIQHQACLLDLPCCYNNDIPWCTKVISIEKPKEAAIPPILTLGLAVGFLYAITKKKCEGYKNKKDCQSQISKCKWIEGKCITKKHHLIKRRRIK